MLIKQLHLIPLLKTSLRWQPFWFLTRPDSDGYQSSQVNSAFFKFEIFVTCRGYNATSPARVRTILDSGHPVDNQGASLRCHGFCWRQYKSNGNRLERPYTQTIRPMTQRGTGGNQLTIWLHFVNKPCGVSSIKYNYHQLFRSTQSIHCLD